MIVAGYAFTPFEDNKIRILNLENTKEAAVIDKNGNMIETTMNDAS